VAAPTWRSRIEFDSGAPLLTPTATEAESQSRSREHGKHHCLEIADGAVRFRPCSPPQLRKSKISDGFFTPANATIIGCLRRLDSSIVRIGGESVDRTTWTPRGVGSASEQVAHSGLTCGIALSSHGRYVAFQTREGCDRA